MFHASLRGVGYADAGDRNTVLPVLGVSRIIRVDIPADSLRESVPETLPGVQT